MGASGTIMEQLVKFIVDYEVGGESVVYKVDDEVMKFERNGKSRFEWNINFNMHVATEEELEEYKNRP